MGEQMADGDLACVLGGIAADHEAGKEFAEWRFKIEQAALVEQHGGGGSGDNLGEAGDIEECIVCYGRCCGFLAFLVQVGEMAYGVLQEGAPIGEEPEGAAREGTR